jgi:hypothetical protein
MHIAGYIGHESNSNDTRIGGSRSISNRKKSTREFLSFAITLPVNKLRNNSNLSTKIKGKITGLAQYFAPSSEGAPH